jgi:hypothetical protein
LGCSGGERTAAGSRTPPAGHPHNGHKAAAGGPSAGHRRTRHVEEPPATPPHTPTRNQIPTCKKDNVQFSDKGTAHGHMAWGVQGGKDGRRPPALRAIPATAVRPLQGWLTRRARKNNRAHRGTMDTPPTCPQDEKRPHPFIKKPIKDQGQSVKAASNLRTANRLHIGVWLGVSQGAEDGRRQPTSRAGHPRNGHKAAARGGPSAGRRRTGHAEEPPATPPHTPTGNQIPT